MSLGNSVINISIKLINFKWIASVFPVVLPQGISMVANKLHVML